MVKITVIIPVYNAGQYLRECLDSVVNQSLRDIEIICVNDGSQDQSLLILDEYKEKDNRIIVINKNHTNAGDARNEGLLLAKGEYLSFLDADDVFDCNMLEKGYKAAKTQEGIDIVIFGARLFSENINNSKHINGSLRLYNCPKHNPFSPSEMNNSIFNSFQNWTWNKLFKKELIVNNNIAFQSISHTNDMLFTCTALVKANFIYVLNDDLVFYRSGHYNNLQSTNHTNPTAFWNAYLETYRSLKLELKEDFCLYKNSLLNNILSGFRYNLRQLRVDLNTHNKVEEMIVNNAENEFKFKEVHNYHNLVWLININWYRLLLTKYKLETKNVVIINKIINSIFLFIKKKKQKR